MKFFLFILIYGIGQITMANQNFPKVMYNMQLKAHNIKCEANLNGLYLYATRGIPKLVSMGQQISEYIDEGKNNINLYAQDISEALSFDEIEKSYCELTISSYTVRENGNTEEKILSHIRYTYIPLEVKDADNESPRFQLSLETSKPLDNSSLAEPIITKSEYKTHPNAEYPIQQLWASQFINVDIYRPFRWIHNSTPLADTLKNKQVVWEAYNELRSAIMRKDLAFFKDISKIGAEDVANFQGDTYENHFDINFDLIVKRLFDLDFTYWKPDNRSYDDYNLELYAGGKLFRLVEKKSLSLSPLIWTFDGNNKLSEAYNPFFTFIDGKIVMATF